MEKRAEMEKLKQNGQRYLIGMFSGVIVGVEKYLFEFVVNYKSN